MPLAGSAPHYPKAQAPISAAGTAPTSAGNSRPLYITLSIVIALLVLAAAGFGAKRWMDARSSENSTAALADNPSPPAPSPTVDATPAPVTPAMRPVPTPSPAPSKASTGTSVKPRATSPQVAQNPEPVAPQQAVPATQTPSNAQAEHRAAEQSARKTVASVAQLAALEHEEFDELQARDNKVNARIAALPQQPGMDVAVPQQTARNELVLAERALQQGDVQTAQKYMEQAEADINKIEKILGH